MAQEIRGQAGRVPVSCLLKLLSFLFCIEGQERWTIIEVSYVQKLTGR